MQNLTYAQQFLQAGGQTIRFDGVERKTLQLTEEELQKIVQLRNEVGERIFSVKEI